MATVLATAQANIAAYVAAKAINPRIKRMTRTDFLRDKVSFNASTDGIEEINRPDTWQVLSAFSNTRGPVNWTTIKPGTSQAGIGVGDPVWYIEDDICIVRAYATHQGGL